MSAGTLQDLFGRCRGHLAGGEPFRMPAYGSFG
jgi:hypothetical protein